MANRIAACIVIACGAVMVVQAVKLVQIVGPAVEWCGFTKMRGGDGKDTVGFGCNIRFNGPAPSPDKERP